MRPRSSIPGRWTRPGTVYTYHLKETNWSDGTPITADDFAYYLLAQLDPNMGSANASTLITTYGFVNAEAYYNGECDVSEVGIKALDDYTLQLTLEEPKADFDGTNITVYPLDADFRRRTGRGPRRHAGELHVLGALRPDRLDLRLVADL